MPSADYSRCSADRVRSWQRRFRYRVSTIDFYTACNNVINQCLGDDGIHPTQAGFDVLTPLSFQAMSNGKQSGPRIGMEKGPLTGIGTGLSR
jgi:hypothetical protein